MPIDERGRALLLGAAIRDIGKQLNWYAGAAAKPGFVIKALSQVGELKNAGVMPDDIAQMAAQAHDPALSAKLGDISRIYAAYSDALAGRFIDGADRQCECLRRFEYAEFLNGADVIMYGFDMITPPLERLAVALCKRVRSFELIIAMPRRDARDYGAYETVALSLNRLVTALRNAGEPCQIEYEPDKPPQGETGFLRREVFAHPMQHWQGEPRMIRLQTLRDPFDEAMEVAAQARELARNGMRWRDIAVVSPRMDEYRHLLERAFALYDVPLFNSATARACGRTAAALYAGCTARDQSRFPAGRHARLPEKRLWHDRARRTAIRKLHSAIWHKRPKIPKPVQARRHGACRTGGATARGVRRPAELA